MQRKLALALAFAVALPAATVGVTGQLNSHGIAQTAADTDVAQTDDGSNFTRLYVDEQYRSLTLKPGESETVEVSVENGEDEAVTIDPHVYVPKAGQRPVEEEWVSIDTGETSLAAGESLTVNATISVPEDAQLGRYSGAIAFNNETVNYPGQPAHPVHSAGLSLSVREEPTVTVTSGSYGTAQVQSGETTVHEIVVENDGDQPVPVNPQIETSDRLHYGGDFQPLEASWFDIEAPAEVAPGESETIEVVVAPPEDADRGRYDATIDLGLQDPARPDDRDHWQRVDLTVEVWEQPAEPFETDFEVAAGTENATLTLTAHSPEGDDGPEPGFDVTFVAPNGTEMDAERVRRTDSGHVSLGADRRAVRSDGDYADHSGEQQFTYRIEEPASGEWSARVMPENTIEFGYEITRDEH